MLMLRNTIHVVEGLRDLPAGVEFVDQNEVHWIMNADKTAVFEADNHCADCLSEISLEYKSEIFSWPGGEKIEVTFESYFDTQLPCSIVSVPYEVYKESVLHARVQHVGKDWF